jgi:hypothetical protein
MAGSTKANGKMAIDMDEEHIIGQMEGNMKVNGKTINQREKGPFIILGVVSMKVKLGMTKPMDMAYIIGVMVKKCMKVSGKMDSNMVME